MIIVYHLENKITEVVSMDNQKIKFDCTGTISSGLIQLAAVFPDVKIVWCHFNYKEHLALEKINTLHHHNKMMLSFRPKSNNFFDNSIGYVEESLFINVNKKVSYPTWQMSSYVGVIHASVLDAIGDKIVCDSDFDYYLSSIAKVGMPLGLLCYSEPKLLIETPRKVASKASSFTLFKFVKQHYKTRWLVLLLLNLLVYEFRFPFIAFLYALMFKDRNKLSISLDHIVVQSSRKMAQQDTIDVIIPTIGRKKYLYDVLQDLSKQTHLPINVIIVEQNPQENSISELDYLHTVKWPFIIKHTFTHHAGACNARNLAFCQVQSEWVFMADDDIRFENNFIQDTFKKIDDFEAKAVTVNCLQKGQKQTENQVRQWNSFGSGCSFVQTEILKNCSFNMSYEFGFGEDMDFGMQIRNEGNDILYLPNPKILHLKAAVGGFRSQPILQWHSEKVQPKPSPTIMLYKMQHDTLSQILGYKTTLFFKYYLVQNIKNPVNYYFYFQKQWKQSKLWANRLKSVE